MTDAATPTGAQAGIRPRERGWRRLIVGLLAFLLLPVVTPMRLALPVTTTMLPEFERALRLDEGMLRYLITLYEHELGAPPTTEADLAAAGRRRDDEDEDEE